MMRQPGGTPKPGSGPKTWVEQVSGQWGVERKEFPHRQDYLSRSTVRTAADQPENSARFGQTTGTPEHSMAKSLVQIGNFQ